MADGYASQYLPAFSRLLGEVEQPTNTQAMQQPQFGGSPEQLMGILQSPGAQATMRQLGIHFDPSTLRQSPFLPNSFMQGHPGLGHLMTGMMANAAATPEAPLVSGAGSGISRAFQGMQGGPEMLRQYQVRQMLAPFQASAATIPGLEFQRKEHLLDLLTKMEQDRQLAAARHEQYVEQSPAGRLQNEIYAPAGAPGWFTREQPRPEGGAQGVDFQQTGQGHPFINPSGPGAGQTIQMPGYGLAPAFQGGPEFHPYDTSQVSAFKQAQETPAQRAEREAKAKELADKGAMERNKGAGVGKGTAKDFSQLQKDKEAEYARLEQRYAPYTGYQEGGKAAVAPPAPQGWTEEQWQAERNSRIQQMNAEKQRIEDSYAERRQMLGVPVPGYLYPGQTSQYQNKPFVSPGASPGSGQAGGAGSQTSQGTAVAPQGLVDPYAQPTPPAQPGQQP